MHTHLYETFLTRILVSETLTVPLEAFLTFLTCVITCFPPNKNSVRPTAATPWLSLPGIDGLIGAVASVHSI